MASITVMALARRLSASIRSIDAASRASSGEASCATAVIDVKAASRIVRKNAARTMSLSPDQLQNPLLSQGERHQRMARDGRHILFAVDLIRNRRVHDRAAEIGLPELLTGLGIQRIEIAL